jgi:DNA-binding transcriptional ArsR family regulator
MKQPSPHPLSPDVLSPVADYFKVLSETSRLQILHCLHEGPMNVMELTEATGFSQANLSKHLKIMTSAMPTLQASFSTMQIYAALT